MKLQTTVELPTDLPSIDLEQRLLMMGSCFAENMGTLFAERKFRVDVNPFGILYNPLSVAKALERMLDGGTYEAEDLFFYREQWHSYMHHGSFSAPTKEETLNRINNRLLRAAQALPGTDWLMLTFGTAYVYRLKTNGEVVSNCHQTPERDFNRSRVTVEDIVAAYRSLTERLLARNDKLKILFTVSPIRHLRDGLHANQLSKATLLLAIDRLTSLCPDRLFYFPSYEIVMDELRDYRFYADDMAHPSPVTVAYLWECIEKCFFTEATRKLVEEVRAVARDVNHRPLHPESEAYRTFNEQIVDKIETLTKKCPYLDFHNELELCHTRLNR